MATTLYKQELLKLEAFLPLSGSNDGSPGIDVDSRDYLRGWQPLCCRTAPQHAAYDSQPEDRGLGTPSKTQLLTRSSCKITLTDAGRSYVAAYKRILDDVVEAERIAIGEYTVPKGELSITAPIVLGRLYLVPVLSDFLQAYPDIDARLTLADQLVNLTEEGVDTALRVGDLPDSALVATRIGTIQCVFAASPGYLTSRGRLRARPISLSMTVSACKVLQGPVSGALPVTPRCQRAIALIVNSTDAACEAAKAGLGIVSVFSHHVVSSFQDGTLIPVLSDFKRPTLPLSLVRASGGYLPIKLQAFLDSVTPGLKMRLSAARKDY